MILLENRQGQVLDLQKYAFEFIEQYKSGWGVLAEEFENTLFSDIDSSLIKARKLCELIVEDIFRKERIDYPRFMKHVEALATLRNIEVLDETLFKSFDRIRCHFSKEGFKTASRALFKRFAHNVHSVEEKGKSAKKAKHGKDCKLLSHFKKSFQFIPVTFKSIFFILMHIR